MGQPAFLTSPGTLLLFGGKGGVGKTTCATAAALHLVRVHPRRTVLLISTDPAHSLLDSLAGSAPPERLTVVELNAQERLEEFKRRNGNRLREIADRGTFFDREDIDRFLSLSLPGMDELFAFLDISRRARDAPPEHCIVVDTAPTGHTLRLLSTPELMYGWLDTLTALLAKHRYMRQVFQRAYVPDELDTFLDDLTASTEAAEAILKDPTRCRFVPVMQGESLSVRETTSLLNEVDGWGISAPEVVVNGLVPEADCAVCAGTRQWQLRTLDELPPPLATRALWSTPLHPREVHGAHLLERFWDDVSALELSGPPEAATATAPMPARVEHPSPLPPPELKLLVLAGKGGVGKTTLACATAVRLARERPGKSVLLFSTDPAHSLGDCLDRTVGPTPTPIMEGLTALEIDASSEFETLKEHYRSELDEFFRSLLGGFDVPFDREVMERLFDLSPPGVDEIMALSRAMDLLAEGRYETFVLDSAPSGHLVRLLEMPELVERWIKALFEVFLKYRDVFRVPHVEDRLVSLSRSLKRFRALMRDPSRAALYAVSILTQMAFDETEDLLSTCRRMPVSVPRLFLNLATPPSACSFCRTRVQQESGLEEQFARSFEQVARTKVFRQAEPRGLERLIELGDALYRA